MPQNKLDPTPKNTTTSLPPWIQKDYTFNRLPTEQQQALLDIINPIYRQLVLQANDPFEKTTAISVVYLLYNELLHQAQIGTTELVKVLPDTERVILMNHLLEFLEPKHKMSWLLLRVRQHNQENEESTPVHNFPLPAAALESTTV